MGFQTLAFGKLSHEVWAVLAAVKTEFGKFEEGLSRVKKQLNTADIIDQTERRTRAMDRKLRGLEQLPEAESAKLLGFDQAESREFPGEYEES